MLVSPKESLEASFVNKKETANWIQVLLQKGTASAWCNADAMLTGTGSRYKPTERRKHLLTLQLVRSSGLQIQITDLLDCQSVAGSRSRQKYCLQSPSPASQAEYRRMGLELRASHQYLTQTLLRSHARFLYLPLIQCAPFSSYICPVTHHELFKVLYACQEPV